MSFLLVNKRGKIRGGVSDKAVEVVKTERGSGKEDKASGR